MTGEGGAQDNPFQVFARVSAVQTKHMADAIDEIKAQLASRDAKCASDHDSLTTVVGRLETIQGAIELQNTLHDQRYNQFETRLTIIEMEQKRLPTHEGYDNILRRLGDVERELRGDRKIGRIADVTAVLIGIVGVALSIMLRSGGGP